ncbi:MAG: hypothetical protein COV67_12600 [Nitrospinae bacterium CG11_big_fil_rev_8_21_14_0_20_56_8]|nr:MAG: hypothetical protein COV67_12600 [Nitrospinae bacterium CG11_big_fil_rev_8_21_14_0_20_56_8]
MTEHPNSAHLQDRLQNAGFIRDVNDIYVPADGPSQTDRSQTSFIGNLIERAGPEKSLRLALQGLDPQLENTVYSLKAEACLELLDIGPEEVCVDWGCRYGTLALGMYKRGGRVIAVDSSLDYLEFLTLRRRQEAVGEFYCVLDDLQMSILNIGPDVVVLNGVLNGSSSRQTKSRLGTVYDRLPKGGRVLFAAKNKFDYSRWVTGREDKTFGASGLSGGNPEGFPGALSFSQVESMMKSAGFSDIQLYMVFPNAVAPDLILPLEGGLRYYREHGEGARTVSDKVRRVVEYFLMKKLQAGFLAPSIMAVGVK